MYLEFKDERDKDFINTYKSVIARFGHSARFMERQNIISEVIHHPAKRFYVSYEQCTRIISRMLKGKTVTFRNPVKKEMYYTILKRVQEKQKNSTLTTGEAIAQIIYAPAPRFYLTTKSASILFYTLLKNRQI